MGATHPKHGSPYIASAVQAVITLVIVRLAKPDAYAEIGRTVIEDSHERSE